jgi:hypothetical protein
MLIVGPAQDTRYLSAFTANNATDGTQLHIDGTLFTQSIQTLCCGPKYVVFNLNGCYTTVTLTPGVDSDNSKDAQEPVSITIADPTLTGKTYLKATYVLAQHPPKPVTFSVKGIVRIRIDFSSADDNVEGAIGNLVAAPVPTSATCP